MPKILYSKGLSYRILFPIKETRDKQVYKALRKDEDTGTEQVVLLKMFSNAEDTYKGEVESLLQAQSNYCVRLLSFEVFFKKKTLVLEYIEGLSLKQLIQNFVLSKAEIHRILGAIYQGLLDLKDKGLSHGDLSLDNVLINPESQIKFIDFGKGNYQKSSQGTFPFIAPEILKGARSNFSSDLFSLGVLEAFLKNPKLLQNQPKEFVSDKLPLLHPDPNRRHFCVNFELQKSSAQSLSYKIKEFLSATQFRHYETQKIQKPTPALFKIKSFLKQVVLIGFFGIFAGASNVSTVESPSGFLTVSTHQWCLIQFNQIKSYTPLQLSLPAGWHLIHWKTAKDKGTKMIHIQPRQTLILNDSNLCNE